jgi:transcriptional regulator with XRE-family HTH domain
MEDPVRRLLAHNLRRIRDAQGLSQMVLAERAEMSTSMVASIETSSKFPGSETIQKLSTALGVHPYELFVDPSNPPSFSVALPLSDLEERLKVHITSVIETELRDFRNNLHSES